jgi:S-adenosylmethionine-dependent methyltransferase
MSSTQQKVSDYYNGDPAREWRRLTEPRSRIEFACTFRLIERYFPATGHVGDIAGGPGRYTLELLERGYRVTLIDHAENLLQMARENLAQAGLAPQAVLKGSAVDLRATTTATFDAALFLGPMYHLVEPDDRRTALAELRRVVKPGGFAIVAFLNAWALLRTGLSDFPSLYRDPTFIESLLAGASFPAGMPGFAPCVFSTPDQAAREMTDAGFEIIAQAGADGFGGSLGPTLAELAARDPQAFENVLRFSVETCEFPQFRDGGDHLHLVVRRT